jgi:hypothetical protein
MSCRTSPEAVDLSHEFAARLLTSLGLVSALAGCGGLVVFVEDGEGAGGFATPVGGSGQGVGGDGVGGALPNCEPSLGPDQHLANECLAMQAGGCPLPGADEVEAKMKELLEWESGCNEEEPCCDNETVDTVLCGPDPTTPDACCYTAIVSHHTECMGRPFTVLGEVRTAALAPRNDWSARLTVECGVVDAATKRALADAFANSALFEHASVASFARFTLDLLSMGAPATLLYEAGRALADEIRHAELCFALSARYGGSPVGPTVLACEMTAPRTAEQMLSEIVSEGCIGETIASLLATRARDQASDPVVRAALAEIAADEARHAELSWKTIAWALAVERPSWRLAIEAAFAGARISTPELVDSLDVSPDVWRAHGQLTRAETSEVVVAARVHVIEACAKALLTTPREPRGPLGPYDLRASDVEGCS